MRGIQTKPVIYQQQQLSVPIIEDVNWYVPLLGGSVITTFVCRNRVHVFQFQNTLNKRFVLAHTHKLYFWFLWFIFMISEGNKVDICSSIAMTYYYWLYMYVFQSKFDKGQFLRYIIHLNMNYHWVSGWASTFSPRFQLQRLFTDFFLSFFLFFANLVWEKLWYDYKMYYLVHILKYKEYLRFIDESNSLSKSFG